MSKGQERRTPPFGWWTRCIVHNVLVHPWLPLADALNALGVRGLPKVIYWAHDVTVPEGGG